MLAKRAARRAWFALAHPTGFKTINRVRRQGITFLDFEALADIYEAVVKVERRGLQGIIIEAGCAAGGSAVVMTAAKNAQRPFFTYDTFGLIPPPSDKDGDDVHQRYEEIVAGNARGPKDTMYYGYHPNLLEEVRQNFRRNGLDPHRSAVTFVKGLYEETLNVQSPVALAHIDCDWYDSVIICLERITPHLEVGGRLVVDDYFSWSGCRAAVDDFFCDRQDEFHFFTGARLQVVRMASPSRPARRKL